MNRLTLPLLLAVMAFSFHSQAEVKERVRERERETIKEKSGSKGEAGSKSRTNVQEREAREQIKKSQDAPLGIKAKGGDGENTLRSGGYKPPTSGGTSKNRISDHFGGPSGGSRV